MEKTILLVEDSSSLRNWLTVLLKKAGYDVIEAGDGADALRKLRGHPVHLMICDVNMPNMDGISFIRAVKELPQYSLVPAIMMTTDSCQDSKQDGRAAGAKAWLTKPFKPDVLLETVSKLVIA